MKIVVSLLLLICSLSVNAEDYVIGDVMSPDVYEIQYGSNVAMVHLLGVHGPSLYHPECQSEELAYSAAMTYLAYKFVQSSSIYFKNQTLVGNTLYADVIMNDVNLGNDLVNHKLAYRVGEQNPWCK